MTDDDRERAVRELTRHCGDGRLTLDELEDRITLVYAAETEAELALAFRELPRFRPQPAEPVRSEPAADRAPQPRARPARAARPSSAPRCGMGRVGGTGDAPIERILRTVWCVAGFVALFNGMFLLALFLWFVLPKLVLPQIRRHAAIAA